MKERSKLNSILKGSIHIEPNFFDKDTYKSILKKITTIKTHSSFQPSTTRYGNRMQAMPCYESVFTFQKKFIVDKIENNDKGFTRFRKKILVRKLERLRVHNEQLRDSVEYWYKKLKNYLIDFLD